MKRCSWHVCKEEFVPGQLVMLSDTTVGKTWGTSYILNNKALFMLPAMLVIIKGPIHSLNSMASASVVCFMAITYSTSGCKKAT
jgi:hypothetical protein